MRLLRLIARLSGRKHLPGLLEHFDPVAKSVKVIDRALKEYLNVGTGLGFQALMAEMDTLEGQADKIKRRIRNHLPLAVWLEVDKTLFLNYTRSQDDILDSAQDALNWLGMRTMNLPDELLKELRAYVADVCRTVELLKATLLSTMDLLYRRSRDRAAVKETCHVVRLQHQKASRAKRLLVRQALATGADFRDVYQFMKFVEHLHAMSHSAEGCADVLRAMIAR